MTDSRAQTKSARIVDLLNRQIEAANNGRPDNIKQWREQSRVALRMAFGEGDEMLKRFDAVKYTPSMWTDTSPQSYFDRVEEAGVQRAMEILRASVVELELSEPEAPAIDVGELHPWVSGSAASLWDGGHRRNAVEESARTIEVQLRAKLGVDGGTGTKLVQAFATSSPKPGQPRLRFSGFEEGSESWVNAHQGAMAFGQGCMMRIRNLYNHGHEPSDAEALEALAALSLLARWIEEAEVEPASGDNS